MAHQSFDIRFHEEQRFKQWWIWLLILGMAAFAWWGFIQQIILGQPYGSNPGPDWMIWLVLVLVGIGFPALFATMRLIVTVGEDQITIRYKPFTTRRIGFEEIESCEARTYKPIKEYAGWGIKGWSVERMSYSVSGKEGVELSLRDGKRVMIGSQKTGQLAEAIGAGLSENR
jgi:hypothetical protein